jgi:hypothetical protein
MLVYSHGIATKLWNSRIDQCESQLNANPKAKEHQDIDLDETRYRGEEQA